MLPLQGLPSPQPANHQTKDQEEKLVNSGDGGQVRSARTKPRHGAKGRGMVWLDHSTPEWDLYAADSHILIDDTCA